MTHSEHIREQLTPTGRVPEGLRSALVLPTLNAGDDFALWLAALREQTYRPDHLLLIDSSSTDDTVDLARDFGFTIATIEREDFSHGGTRQKAVESLGEFDVIVFLTQDARLAKPCALEALLAHFRDDKVAAAYGRQLPRLCADPIEAHARLFNYPEGTEVRSSEDIPRLGLKTSFISNSFAAYRRDCLEQIGGFPENTIQNEDTHAASRLILAGWKVAYVSEAVVYHSHPFTMGQEFRRYFDIGVFHARERWIREKFGSAGGEGMRFVRSELRHLWKERPSAIPSALIRTGLKLAGFKLGNSERMLPTALKKRLSANKSYWQDAPREAETV